MGDEDQGISCLFITANVGSIFEDPENMLEIWINEFIKVVKKLNPKMIALHCQEVGGKNYENSMKHVEHFIKLLLATDVIHTNYDKIRIYLDEDYSAKDHFTALGNFYLIHESVNNIKYYDFKESAYINVDQGQQIYSGNIESIPTKNKAKFPQHFFPEFKWSRKGYMRTRWLINNTINIDLINVHLFHDASNFVAMEEYPSVYCMNRRRALLHILEQINNDHHPNIPFFIFGDFNFRTDTNSVVKKLTDGLITNRIQNANDNNKTKLQYFNTDQQLILTVGKKEFTHLQHQNVFLNQQQQHNDQNNDDPNQLNQQISWLKSMDKEFDAFDTTLYEYPVTFPPSYPFVEQVVDDKDTVSSYMHTRCPSWCDRILISNTAKSIINEKTNVEYNMIGLNTCMGDHKPIYLNIELISTNNNNN
ncbi:inositol polyphosphate-5-phosphatase A, partial [Chrysoperla carnea]|uniref:inositol polyphosphate-5-phosphatase A n=1 Tax=Chrysoperla carnea TaxID=189513 RepID=UPI001D092815